MTKSMKRHGAAVLWAVCMAAAVCLLTVFFPAKAEAAAKTAVIRRYTEKTGRQSKIARFSSGIHDVYVCGDHLLAVTYDDARGATYCLSVNGKNRKKLGSWGWVS